MVATAIRAKVALRNILFLLDTKQRGKVICRLGAVESPPLPRKFEYIAKKWLF
jgi:hypothetical protein